MPASRLESGAYIPRISRAGCGKEWGRMRVMFFTWLVLIAAGLAFYSVIGLTHN
jgi:hypothetical protein